MPKKCCVPGCNSNYFLKSDGGKGYVSVFRFPKDPVKKQAWLNNICRGGFVPSRSSVVCRKHFPPECVSKEDFGEDGRLLRRPKLRANAVPCIFDNAPTGESFERELDALEEDFFEDDDVYPPTKSRDEYSKSSDVPDSKVKRNYFCKSCSFHSLNPREYLNHLKNRHGEKFKIYECPYCCYASRHSLKLKNHVMDMHERKRDSSTPKSLSSKPNGNEAEVMEGDNTECNDFEAEEALRLEESDKEGMDEDSLDGMDDSLGGMTYQKPITISRTKNTFFKCKSCPYMTHIKARFVKHLKQHNSPPLECEFCEFKTIYRWALDRHIEKLHFLNDAGLKSISSINDEHSRRQEHNRASEFSEIASYINSWGTPLDDEIVKSLPKDSGTEEPASKKPKIDTEENGEAHSTFGSQSENEVKGASAESSNASRANSCERSTKDKEEESSNSSFSSVSGKPKGEKKLTDSFFDSFKIKDVESLICSECGHESSCLSESIRHKKTHSRVSQQGAVTGRGTRCQYCRRRCKTEMDLLEHEQVCEAAQKSKDPLSLGEESDKGSPTKEIIEGERKSKKTEEEGDGKSKIFVWNDIPEQFDDAEASGNDSDIEIIGESSKKNLDIVIKREQDLTDPESPKSSNRDESSGDGSSLKKVYKCPHCEFWATTASRFHVHIVGHVNQKPFKCSDCFMRSNWQWDITKHIRQKRGRGEGHEHAEMCTLNEGASRNYDQYEQYTTLMMVDKSQDTINHKRLKKGGEDNSGSTTPRSITPPVAASSPAKTEALPPLRPIPPPAVQSVPKPIAVPSPSNPGLHPQLPQMVSNPPPLRLPMPPRLIRAPGTSQSIHKPQQPMPPQSQQHPLIHPQQLSMTHQGQPHIPMSQPPHLMQKVGLPYRYIHVPGVAPPSSIPHVTLANNMFLHSNGAHVRAVPSSSPTAAIPSPRIQPSFANLPPYPGPPPQQQSHLLPHQQPHIYKMNSSSHASGGVVTQVPVSSYKSRLPMYPMSTSPVNRLPPLLPKLTIESIPPQQEKQQQQLPPQPHPGTVKLMNSGVPPPAVSQGPLNIKQEVGVAVKQEKKEEPAMPSMGLQIQNVYSLNNNESSADNSQAESKKPESKKTVWKCKKCNFRHPDKQAMMAHIKGHYQALKEALQGLRAPPKFRCGVCPLVSNDKGMVEFEGRTVLKREDMKRDALLVERAKKICDPSIPLVFFYMHSKMYMGPTVFVPSEGLATCHAMPHDSFTLVDVVGVQTRDSSVEWVASEFIFIKKHCEEAHGKIHIIENASAPAVPSNAPELPKTSKEPEGIGAQQKAPQAPTPDATTQARASPQQSSSEDQVQQIKKEAAEGGTAVIDISKDVEEPQLQCKICPYRCNSPSDMKEHSSHHKIADKEGSQCNFCPYYPENEDALFTHLKLHGIMNPKEYVKQRNHDNKKPWKSSPTSNKVPKKTPKSRPDTPSKEIEELRTPPKNALHLRLVKTESGGYDSVPPRINGIKKSLASPEGEKRAVKSFKKQLPLDDEEPVSLDSVESGSFQDEDDDTRHSDADSKNANKYRKSSLLSTKVEAKFYCEDCPFRSNNRTHFFKHRQFHTSKDPQAVHKCPLCSYRVAKRNLILQHLRVHETFDDHEVPDKGDQESDSKESTPQKQQVNLFNQFKIEDFKASKPKETAKKVTTTKVEVKEEGTEESDKIGGPIDTSKFTDIPQVWVLKGTEFVKSFKCRFCPHTNSKKSNIFDHEKMHNADREMRGTKIYTCSLCNYVCANRGLITVHINIHKNMFGRVVGLVDKSKSDYEQVKELSKTMIKNRKEGMWEGEEGHTLYFCQNCPARFTSPKEIVVHSKFHDVREFEHACNECSYKARHELQLEAHKKVHGEEYWGKTKLLLRSHIIADTAPPCQAIREEAEKFAMVKIVQNLISKGYKPHTHAKDSLFYCEQCPAFFTKYTPYVYHKRFHGADGEFRCDKCNYAVSNLGNLARHQQVHEDGYRDLTLMDEQNAVLDDSMSVNTQEVADMVKKSKGQSPNKNASVIVSDPAMMGNPDFFYPTYLKHGKVKEKRYKCPKCPTAMDRREGFNAHLSLHEAKNKYTCPKCSYSVKFFANYLHHQSRHRWHDDVRRKKLGVQDEGVAEDYEPIVSDDHDGERHHGDEALRLQEHKELMAESDELRKPEDLTIEERDELLQQLLTNGISLNSKQDIKQFHCFLCPYSTNKRTYEISHLSRHSKGETQTVCCPYCDFRAPERHYIRDHVKVHFRNHSTSVSLYGRFPDMEIVVKEDEAAVKMEKQEPDSKDEKVCNGQKTVQEDNKSDVINTAQGKEILQNGIAEGEKTLIKEEKYIPDNAEKVKKDDGGFTLFAERDLPQEIPADPEAEDPFGIVDWFSRTLIGGSSFADIGEKPKRKPYVVMASSSEYKALSVKNKRPPIYKDAKRYSEVCPHCPMLCKTAGRLERHIAWHGSNNKYKCDKCDYSVNKASYVQLHNLYHTKKYLRTRKKILVKYAIQDPFGTALDPSSDMSSDENEAPAMPDLDMMTDDNDASLDNSEPSKENSNSMDTH